jgi:1-acyl-sn-glycerol-3-phosphate acyltransferase
MANTHLKIRAILQHGFQFLILVVGKIALQPFTRVYTSAVNPKILKNQPYLIVANHRGWIDPFVIGCCLPVGTVFKITPVGFMTKNIFYDSPLRPFLWISGAYPARDPKGKHAIFGVDGSVQLLQNGFSAFIFPEGTRIKEGQGAAHSGVLRIHKAMPHVPLMLCHIEYNKGFKAWLTGQRRVVKYGLVENPNYDDPNRIMDDVFAL